MAGGGEEGRTSEHERMALYLFLAYQNDFLNRLKKNHSENAMKRPWHRFSYEL